MCDKTEITKMDKIKWKGKKIMKVAWMHKK